MYKGHEIIPIVVCFDIRYLVVGSQFDIFESFESYEVAKKEIDKRIGECV